MKSVGIPVRIIVLRNKTKIQVSFEAGEKIKEALSNITEHKFFTVKELDRVINSADIVEVANGIETKYIPDEPIPERTLEETERIKKLTEKFKEDVQRILGKGFDSKKCKCGNELTYQKEFCSSECMEKYKN